MGFQNQDATEDDDHRNNYIMKKNVSKTWENKKCLAKEKETNKRCVKSIS